MLYDAVRTHLPEFLEHAHERSGRALPKYVVDEFHRFLACGLLEAGFVRVFCDACGHDFLVAFSCKRRGFCASCSTRRMTGTAALIVDRVIPDVPVRQWVLTVPHSLRMLLAQKPAVLTAVHRILVTEIERAYLATTATDARDAERHPGSVTFVQRFSGSLGLHVHFHLVAADGVFVRDTADSAVRFVAAPPPTPAVLADVVRRVHTRVIRWLRRRRLLVETPVEERSNELPDEDPLTSCLRAATAQGTFGTMLDPSGAVPVARGADPGEAHFAPPRGSRWVARQDGFNLHAGVTVEQGHRVGLERLCRYGARPGLALDRLSRLPDGRYAYRMKYPVNGHTHRFLTPMERMARLAGIVPPPRYPLVRYAGVFAPASPWRALVTPPHPAERRCCALHERERQLELAQRRAALAPPATAPTAPVPPSSNSDRERAVPVPSADIHLASTTTPASPDSPAHLAIAPAFPTAGAATTATRIDWASLLRHGLEIDALKCRCGARMRILAAVTQPAQVQRILAHLREPTGQRIPTRAWDPVPFDPADVPPDEWTA